MFGGGGNEAGNVISIGENPASYVSVYGGGAMGADAVQLILLDTRQKVPMALAWAALGAFFAMGFGYGVIRFRIRL
jgi:hypothetical protein